METIRVYIKGLKVHVDANVVQRYPDGDIRVEWNGKQHVVAPVQQLPKEGSK